MSRSLAVHLGGRRVGTLTEARTNKLRFSYDDDVIAEGPLGVPLLSARLPLRSRPYTHGDISPFVEGLLPEGPARDRMEDTLGVRRRFTFDLLAEAGRDCAGAVTFTAPDAPPPAHRVAPVGEPLDDETIARLLSSLPDRPLGAATDVRVSLAGQQSKLLVTRLADGWGRPVDGTPSTHIFKPEDARLPRSARAEAFGLALASLVGLSMIDADVLEIEGRPVLSVERFDRVRHLDGTIERLHQEDLCQALGIDTTRVPGCQVRRRPAARRSPTSPHSSTGCRRMPGPTSGARCGHGAPGQAGQRRRAREELRPAASVVPIGAALRPGAHGPLADHADGGW